MAKKLIIILSFLGSSGCVSIRTHEHAVKEAHLNELAYAESLTKKVDGGLLTPEDALYLLKGREAVVEVRWPEK